MIVSDAQHALLATDRWAWLSDVVGRWYAEPLCAADGSPADEIAAAAERVGADLPPGLVEWFTLVGRRLRPVQDAATTPATLGAHGDGVVVWTENQGVWSLVAAPDGTCTSDDEGFPFPPTPLERTLHGMVLSDTVVGVWAGTRIGPLGPLAPGVRGGTVPDADADDFARLAGYPELPVPGNPFWGAPPRGDADAVLRGDEDSGSGLEWMTASPEAFARLSALIALDPPDGPQEIVVDFADLTPAERAGLTREHGVPDTDRVAAAIGDLGRIRMGAGTPTGVRFHLTTTRPAETIAALRATIPPELVDKVVLAVRPERISTFRVVHPADRADYVLPD